MMKCWKSGCQNEVKVFCECIKPEAFSCAKHFIEHIDNDTVNVHLPSGLYKKPLSTTKSSLLNELSKSSAELANFKSELIEKVTMKIQNLQSMLNKALSLIEEVYFNQRMLINKLESIETIPKWNLDPYEELLSLPIDKALRRLNNFTYSAKHLNFTIKDILTANSDLNLRTWMSNEWDSKEILYFKNQSKYIIKIDLESLEKAEKELSVEDNAYPAGISMCQVPGRGLFCYGNHPGKGTAYILHSDYSIEKLKSGPVSGNMNAALYDDYIYLFGGWDSVGSPWKKAFKYSLLDDDWMNISDISEDLSFISNIVTNEGILLAGYQSSKIYRYDIECDTYFELASFTQATWKKLCHSSDKNFLIQSSGDIYENNPKCLSQWHPIKKFTEQLNRAPITYSITFENSEYFVDEACNLYKFDFKDSNLSRIIIQ